MKKYVVMIIACLTMCFLCACGGNDGLDKETRQKYDAIINDIENSKGAYNVWKEIKKDEIAAKYILMNVSDGSFTKFMIEDMSLYGGMHYSPSVMGEVLEIVINTGVEHFSKEKILSGINAYATAVGGVDTAELEHLSGKEFYEPAETYIKNMIGVKDAESLLLTEAIKRAERRIKDNLKDPSSYKRIGLTPENIKYDASTGKYSFTFVITYSATNSFGGTVTDDYKYTETGTYIDGKISFKN